MRPPPQIGNAQWFIFEDMFADRHVVQGAGADTAPAITKQPEDLVVVAGGAAEFRVTATGNPAPSYQWRRQGTNLAGATLPMLTLSNVQPADAGEYSVLVSNRAGEVLSRAATLQVTIPTLPPAIVQQPASQTVAAGTRVTFQVTAEGAPPLMFQWSKDGTDLAGRTDATLVIEAVRPEDAGTYRVRVDNAVGTALSEGAVLTVTAAEPIRLSVVRAEERLLFVWTGGTPPFRLRARGEVSSGPWSPLLETTNRMAEFTLTNPSPAALFFVVED